MPRLRYSAQSKEDLKSIRPRHSTPGYLRWTERAPGTVGRQSLHRRCNQPSECCFSWSGATDGEPGTSLRRKIDTSSTLSVAADFGPIVMSSIPAPVRQVLQARNDATRQQINTALMRKSMDVQQQTGEAINALIEQAVQVQRQIADGHIDVKV
jgi:hypothetical protein